MISDIWCDPTCLNTVCRQIVTSNCVTLLGWFFFFFFLSLLILPKGGRGFIAEGGKCFYKKKKKTYLILGDPLSKSMEMLKQRDAEREIELRRLLSDVSIDTC